MEHVVRWIAPAPLWGRFEGANGTGTAFLTADQARPSILRFASDDFMDQLLAMLAADPRQIGSLLARPETWRSQLGDAPDLVERVPLPRIARSLARLQRAQAPSTALSPTTHEIVAKENGVARTTTLKLYQPAHQRYYLVGANLVCERVGLPDRVLNTNGSEQVGFVLRRLFPPGGATAQSPLEEYAFIKDATGSRWQRIEPDSGAADPAARLLAGEELLPLFPLGFRDDANHPRRLLAGLVPVGRREEYMGTRMQRSSAGEGAGAAGVAANPSPIATRKEQLKMEVVEPWKNLVRTAIYAADRIMDGSTSEAMPGAERDKAALAHNDQAQGQSWLVLLDFADYLQLHLEPVWNCVLDPARRSSLATDGQRRLFDWMNSPQTAPASNLKMSRDGRPFATTLREALRQIRATAATRLALERATRPFPEEIDAGLQWPGFAYPLAGVITSQGGYKSAGVHESLPGASGTPPAGGQDADAAAPAKPAVLRKAETEAAFLDKLVQLVIGALDGDTTAAAAPPLPFAVRLRDALVTTQGDPGWFVLRCVHIRCDCGPLQPATISPPTQRFQLASFFDPDAPARPIRISLPLDTTPAGMRKHNRNTAFVISDVLCGQIQRAKGLGLGDLVRSVLPWPLHKDLDVGGLAPCEERPGATIGMICSLSLPIITICALILLMIIVSLLDFIFRWLPWFAMCFPIPGLKAKKPEGVP